MSDRQTFRWATTSARLLVGSLVAIGAVTLVVTAISLPWPAISREPAVVRVVPGAASTTVVCAGDLLVVGRDLDDPTRLTPAATQTVTSAVIAGASQPESQPLSVVDGDLTGPLALTVDPTDGERTDLAASGSASVFADDIAGFAAAACRPPLVESWLVGGSAATGAADLVLLANPGSVVATVQITVFGSTGPQTPPGAIDIIVPARSQRVIPLAGIALGEESPVLRVTASGAPVQASLQTSLTRVLDPVGVDQVGPLVAAAETQVIAGVEVTRPRGDAGASDATSVVRVLSPSADASATITVRGVGARDAAIAPVTVPLSAGMPTEVDLGGLSVGRYVVDVEADTPVVAAVWQSDGVAAGADFAWYTPSPEVTEATLFAVPRGAPARLVMVNPGDAAVDVTLATAQGAPAGAVSVPPGGSADLALSTGQVYRLDTGGAPLRAAVTQTGDSALAGFPVWARDAATPAITVYP